MKRITLERVGTVDTESNLHYVNLHKGLNVITGHSATGKSTILEIIDYCFGKSEITGIPNTINEISGWHFIICKQGENKFIIARSAKKKTQFKLINLFSDDDITDIIYSAPIIDWNEINRLLFLKHGIEVQTITDERTKRERRITFRNCMTFCLQNKSLCTSSENLLYRMNNKDKKRSLSLELPLLTGMIDIDYFEQCVQLNNYTNEINKLKDKIKNYNEEDEMKQILLLVKSLFLQTNNESKFELVHDYESFNIYKKTLERIDPFKIITNEEVRQIFDEIKDLEREISKLKFRQNQIEHYLTNMKDVSNQMSDSQQKAMIIEDVIKDFNVDREVETLCNEMRSKINDELSRINININLDLIMEKKKITNEINIKIKNRDELQKIINDLDNQVAEEISYEEKMKRLFKLEIEIEEKFKNFNNYLGSLKTRLKKVQDDKDVLEKLVKIKKESLNRSLGQFENDISSYIDEDIKGFYPEFEHREKRIGFDLADFDCYFDRDGDKTYLSNWGSDNNILFAHVATILSIQRTLANYETCIPAFITFDQLSRPYFPDSLEMKDSSDLKLLSKIYDSILRVIKEISNNTETDLQVIVVEHANEGMSKDYLKSKIKDDHGNKIDFRDGRKYINEDLLKINVFELEKTSNKKIK